ncbi:MAG: hypothetical protein K2Y23_20955 [Cyanobacteria bacterium]|nr:hypothetical protein [Cyanobacteriota bacterium]
MRNLGLVAVLLIAVLPRPAQAQGDFIKQRLKSLVERSGIYVSLTTRTAVDDEVRMGTSLGIGWGLAGKQRTGKKYPFSFSSYSGDLQTNAGSAFGRIKARQIMSGIGYQWVRGKLVYGGQIGVGYSFNSVTLNPGVAMAFGVPEPVGVSVSNSFVVRPQAKVEYFVHRKMSLRTQFGYTYTDPQVVIRAVTQDFADDWNPHHWQLSFAVGFFPLRK